MAEQEINCGFGPVPSRRLGRSLGIDIVPFKTCTYDCIYCQLGRTTEETVSRSEFIAIDKILNDIHGVSGKNRKSITSHYRVPVSRHSTAVLAG
jgi:wyosine [tRNA(Phe)-imidazoG37] synthetase (radical SAM superfamily)